MNINFNIINQKLDLTSVLKDSTRKEWWFNNTIPKIPLETKSEDLTDSQKISLVKLAIYEGWFDIEMISNLPDTSFQIINHE